MKRKNRLWEVKVQGITTGVVAKTAGAAARRAFRQLIQTPRDHFSHRHWRPHAPLQRQPASELDGNFEGTNIRLVA